MSKCIHANKLHDNLWCSTACMYCTLSQEETCRHRKDVPVRKVVKTNADHIRSMSDEELADYMSEHSIEDFCYIICGGECKAIASFTKTPFQRCREIVSDWLKQPYKEDT